MPRPYLADLHVHSVLSPCADELMLPGVVLEVARARGLALLAITDHNSVENAPAFAAAAAGSGVFVVAGIEVTTREEVHLLGLFPDHLAAEACQAGVYAHLPPLPNNERLFGTQLVVDARDELVRVNERLLSVATDLSLSEAVALVVRCGGLAIPAHIDRPRFGLLGQLGFVPPDLRPAAFEVSRHVDPHRAQALDRALAGQVIVQSSDAHAPAEVGVVGTVFWLAELTFAELAAAFRGERRVTYASRGLLANPPEGDK